MIGLAAMKSRIAALGVLVLAVFLFGWLLVYPVVDRYRLMSDEIDDRRFQIARYRNLAASHDSLRRRLGQLKRENSAATRYVSGESAALASANMQQYLRSMLDSVGGELVSTQQVDRGTADSEIATSLQVHMKADLATLVQIFYRLENAQPMFFIDELVINARPLRSGAQPRPAAVVLDVRFRLTGYRRGQA